MKLSRNIDTTGRLLRLLMGGVMAGVTWWTWLHFSWAAILPGVFAALCLFQAFQGWCLARACGIKTRW